MNIVKKISLIYAFAYDETAIRSQLLHCYITTDRNKQHYESVQIETVITRDSLDSCQITAMELFCKNS